jgi:alkylation response protein AidB-like acyl-CoA dehydrogenase
VDFDYSDDQKFLKDEARKFLAARCPSSVVRGVLDDPAKSYDAGLWSAVAEQGWLGAAIPEDYNGLGLGRVELCAIAEELGRAVAPIPFASTVYVLAEAVMAHGSDAQKAAILPRIAAGELIGCLATSEGPGVITPRPCRPRSRAASSPASRSRSPTATRPTWPWCWPTRAGVPACSWST